MNNPDFAFLFEYDSKEGQYYRWKVKAGNYLLGVMLVLGSVCCIYGGFILVERSGRLYSNSWVRTPRWSPIGKPNLSPEPMSWRWCRRRGVSVPISLVGRRSQQTRANILSQVYLGEESDTPRMTRWESRVRHESAAG